MAIPYRRLWPALACLSLGCRAPQEPSDAGESTLIVGARVIDGTGAPGRVTAVRVHAGRIEAVGALEARAGEHVVHARGLVLAPGFIDTHSHHDGNLRADPSAIGAVSQGITTIVVGQDGSSRTPLRAAFARLEAEPAAVNVASYAGHGSIRARVMGSDARPATSTEIEAMRSLLRRDLAAGALGLSTGLEYDPGIWSTTEELVALAEEVARVGGRYISHMRSEDRTLWEAVDEVIHIGRETGVPVQISHMKLAMKSLWGRADELLARLDQARAEGVDVTADVYPYTYWQSSMTVLFPERDFTDRAAAEFALRELAPPEGMVLMRFEPNPDYVGKSIAEIAALRGTDPVTAYLALIAESRAAGDDGGGESVIAESMDADDVWRLIAWPHTNLCSDGSSRGGHPRGFGAFPRAIAHRERAGLSLEAAIHKLTALAAEHVGLSGRGVIAPGAAADLVLFDPERIADRATVADPKRTAAGIELVWVNGILVWSEGRATGARPGAVIRRATAP
ncbi:MAG: D-aminoacylase [Planctomycetota bacterium]|nr:MAG: D-aminoacylase [Planctomycetota bacterium]